jgi:hypothetical protein
MDDKHSLVICMILNKGDGLAFGEMLKLHSVARWVTTRTLADNLEIVQLLKIRLGINGFILGEDLAGFAFHPDPATLVFSGSE